MKKVLTIVVMTLLSVILLSCAQPVSNTHPAQQPTVIQSQQHGFTIRVTDELDGVHKIRITGVAEIGYGVDGTHSLGGALMIDAVKNASIQPGSNIPFTATLYFSKNGILDSKFIEGITPFELELEQSIKGYSCGPKVANLDYSLLKLPLSIELISGDSVIHKEKSSSYGRVSFESRGEFTGNYTVFNKDGSSYSRSVEGYAPMEFNIDGQVVSCVFQKQMQYGYLRVDILKGNQIIAGSDTNAAYGVVSVATR